MLPRLGRRPLGFENTATAGIASGCTGGGMLSPHPCRSGLY